jgi:hypothetical protein
LLLAVLELRQLLAVDTEDLVAELLGHICYHFFNHVIFESLTVVSYSILAFKCKSESAVFFVFEPGLSIQVTVKVSLALLELLNKHVLLFVFKGSIPCIVNPPETWICKLVKIDVRASVQQIPFFSFKLSFNIFYLVNRSILWIFNKFLWSVVVFELDFLQM